MHEIQSKHDLSFISVSPSLPLIHHDQTRNASVFVYYSMIIENIFDIDIWQYNLLTSFDVYEYFTLTACRDKVEN